MEESMKQAVKMLGHTAWEAIVNLMDDAIREDLHSLGFCGPSKFLAQYLMRHEAKFSESFTV